MRRPWFRRDRPPSIIATLVALTWLAAAVAVPSDPAGWQVYGLLSIPMELAVAVAAFVIVPPLARSGLVRWLLALAVTALIVLKVWDALIHLALGRTVDVYVDGDTIGATWELTVGNIGIAGAFLAATVLALVLLALLAVNAAAIRTLQRVCASRPANVAALALAVVALLVWGVWKYWDRGIWGPARPVNDVATVLVGDQIRRFQNALNAEPAFRAAERQDPVAGIQPPALFSGLEGADVVLIFVESYGRSALDDPLYAPTGRAAIEAGQAQLDAAGVLSTSGWLTSPTLGGLSWLAHSTIASGMWIDSQLDYNLLITGDRPALARLFGRAGYDTLIVAPQIVNAWPERAFFGYDRTLFWDGLGYGGKPFGWVQMPDQYVLAAFERLKRPAGSSRPLFAEIDLATSHAPWTPLPQGQVPWDQIGDGTVFDPWTEQGESPRAMWLDGDKVRAAYIRSIDYSMRTVANWAATYLDDHTIAIVLGDHQPAPIVIGDSQAREVPVHVLSRDPHMLEPFREWGFADGMNPDRSGTVRAMSDFRGWFVETFSERGRTISGDGG